MDVRDPDLCPRFVGRWVSGVTIGPSPDRVQMRLLAAGQRPVSNVVDASNYVMLELGKPIHTFDAARRPRRRPTGGPRSSSAARIAGERLETLDHVERELATDMLLIADAEGPIGVAGVMGGATSEVSDATTDVVIESAVFDPVSIRRTAQRLALRSEASSRFEKGQESRLAWIGADRTAQLVAEWAGGSVAPGRVDTAPRRSRALAGRLPPGAGQPAPGHRARRPTEQRALLARVGIETEPAAADEAVTVALRPEPVVVDAGHATRRSRAIVPTWRRDVVIEADVAEEIARVRGYELVPSVTPAHGHAGVPARRRSRCGS